MKIVPIEGNLRHFLLFLCGLLVSENEDLNDKS